MDILWDIIIYYGVHLKCNEDRDEGRNNGSINNSVKGHITGELRIGPMHTPTFEGWTDILRDGKVITDWLLLIDAHGPRETEGRDVDPNWIVLI